MLGDGERLHVPEGRSVTLLSSKGENVRLTGPYTGVPTTEGEVGAARLSDDAGVISRVTVCRFPRFDEDRAALPPGDPWVISGRPGPQCVRDPGQATLWRSDSTHTVKIAIAAEGADVAGDRSVESVWLAGEATLPWPDAIEITDGSAYVFSNENEGESIRFTLHVVPELPSDLARALWMADHGCKDQARALVMQIR